MLSQFELKKFAINNTFTLIKALDKIQDNAFIEDLISIIKEGDLAELSIFNNTVKEITKK